VSIAVPYLRFSAHWVASVMANKSGGLEVGLLVAVGEEVVGELVGLLVVGEVVGLLVIMGEELEVVGENVGPDEAYISFLHVAPAVP